MEISNELPKSVRDNEDKFIQWATLWHGEHDGTGEEQCEVHLALQWYGLAVNKLEDVYKAVVETEGFDWSESWERFLEESK